METRRDPGLEAAIRAVDAWRGQDIGITPVSADRGERHFLIEAGDELFVLRLTSPASTRPLADLAAEVDIARAAAAAGVAPEVIAFLPQLGCLVTRSASGSRLAPDDAGGHDVLASVVGSVRALHACPPPGVERSMFRDAEELKRAAAARGVAMPGSEPAASEAMRRIEDAVTARGRRTVACHGDLTAASLFLEDEQVWIVDYRWAGARDAFEDLGSIAAHLDLSDELSDELLRLYFGTLDDRKRSDLLLARAAAVYLAAMRRLARPGMFALMHTLDERLAGVAAAAARAGAT